MENYRIALAIKENSRISWTFQYQYMAWLVAAIYQL